MHPFVKPTVRLINWVIVIFIFSLVLQGIGSVWAFGFDSFWSDFLNMTAIVVVIEIINYAKGVIDGE